jgi:Ca-activated chloride channel family protein
VVGFRRGLLFLLPLVIVPGLMYPESASADWWDDAWQRRDQQAYKALKEDQSERAAVLAVEPGLSGEAWYRTGEYSQAMESWSRLDSADAHYNRGNALAYLGELDSAIEAYDSALALEPEMEDALINRALVEQMKQHQEQEGEEGETGDSESSSEQQDAEQSEQSAGESDEEGDQSEEQQGEQDQSEGEMNEGEEPDYSDSWSEEDEQAMEQWLRRIPDDPGGLLRRKFRNEHQRRGAPEDEVEAW